MLGENIYNYEVYGKELKNFAFNTKPALAHKMKKDNFQNLYEEIGLSLKNEEIKMCEKFFLAEEESETTFLQFIK